MMAITGNCSHEMNMNGVFTLVHGLFGCEGFESFWWKAKRRHHSLIGRAPKPKKTIRHYSCFPIVHNMKKFIYKRKDWIHDMIYEKCNYIYFSRAYFCNNWEKINKINVFIGNTFNELHTKITKYLKIVSGEHVGQISSTWKQMLHSPYP